MAPLPSVFELSLRRSRHRLRVLLALSSLGEAYVGQLARLTGIPWGRVQAILVGGPPAYRVDLSLVGLGLACVDASSGRRVFTVTPRGVRKARSVVAALARSRRARDGDLRVGGALALSGGSSVGP